MVVMLVIIAISKMPVHQNADHTVKVSEIFKRLIRNVKHNPDRRYCNRLMVKSGNYN